MEGVVNDPDLVIHPVARDRIVIVVAPDHPMARRDTVQPDDLYATDWVLHEPGSGTRSAFEQALLAQRILLDRLRVALELPSNEAVRAAVEARSESRAQIANKKRMITERDDDLRRFTAPNHCLLHFDHWTGVVLPQPADRLEKSSLRTTSLSQEAF